MDNCPKCTAELRFDKGLYICDACSSQFKSQYHCDVCGHTLEKLQACGSVSFFCHHCNMLKSKSKVVKTFESL